MGMADDAAAYFRQGYNCCQSVLAACGEDPALPRETALRMAQCFGGGMGNLGEVCGVVSGSLMALGLKFGSARAGDQEAKARGAEMARRLISQFAARHRAILCRDLLGCDLRTPEGLERARREKLFATLCPRYVRDAAEIVEGLLQNPPGAEPGT